MGEAKNAYIFLKIKSCKEHLPPKNNANEEGTSAGKQLTNAYYY